MPPPLVQRGRRQKSVPRQPANVDIIKRVANRPVNNGRRFGHFFGWRPPVTSMLTRVHHRRINRWLLTFFWFRRATSGCVYPAPDHVNMSKLARQQLTTPNGRQTPMVRTTRSCWLLHKEMEKTAGRLGVSSGRRIHTEWGQ